jgi:hypothetical protein
MHLTRATLFFLGLSSAVLSAQAILNVPTQYPTIQSAIVAAASGDVVLVAPGTHFGAINFLGKAILVRSSDGAAATVIDAGAGSGVVTFASAETAASILDGFTLTNGQGQGFGTPGGIDIVSASPIVRNCVVANCVGAGGQPAAGTGGPGGPGGLRVNGGAPRIENVTFTNNVGGVGGAATGCSPFGTATGGIGGVGAVLFVNPTAATVFDRCTVEANVGGSGGAVACATSLATGGIGGSGGIDVTALSGNSLTLTRCVLRQNTAGNGAAGAGSAGGAGGIGGLGARSTSSFFGAPSLTLIGCTVVSNGGGTGQGTAAGGDGGVSALSFQITMRHSTVAANISGPNNMAGSGGVVFGGAMTASGTFVNTIVFANIGTGAAVELRGVGLPAFATNCIVGSSSGVAGTGHSSATPLFVLAGGGDFHLSAASPARDTGAIVGPIATFDRDGDPRIVGPLPDRGSDEYDSLFGTREDLTLSISVDGVVPGTIPTASAAAGQTVAANIGSPNGTFTFAFVFLVGEFWVPPFPPVTPPGLPEVRISPMASIIAVLSGVPPAGVSIGAAIPPGLSGLVVRLQVMSPFVGGANGIFAASAGRDVIFL